MITYSFEGSSHGRGYCGEICGLPNGFVVDVDQVNAQLALRKSGYGRSSRQTFADVVTFDGQTGNTVIVNGNLRFFVPNAKVENRPNITALRSGHTDLVGVARYPHLTARDVAEISSARNSLCYVVLGAICKQILAKRNVFTYHYVQNIGGITARGRYKFGVSERQPHFAILNCPCKSATQRMVEKIDQTRSVGNSLGGIVVVGATGLPMGVGEVLPYTSRLDSQISAYMMGIPSVKGISFGLGNGYASSDGVSARDQLEVQNDKIVYATNNCGGIVGGISTGQDVLFALTVKPVPTVKEAQTVDSVTMKPTKQHFERADTCVVPNVGVVANNVLAYVLLNQLLLQEQQ